MAVRTKASGTVTVGGDRGIRLSADFCHLLCVAWRAVPRVRLTPGLFLMVSVDVKHHVYLLCPSELMSCVKVEVAVLGSRP